MRRGMRVTMPATCRQSPIAATCSPSTDCREYRSSEPTEEAQKQPRLREERHADRNRERLRHGDPVEAKRAEANPTGRPCRGRNHAKNERVADRERREDHVQRASIAVNKGDLTSPILCSL